MKHAVIDLEKTGLQLSFWLQKRKITQEELARKLHVSSSTVSKWCLGKALPSLDHFIALCTILKIRPEALFVIRE